MGRLFLEPLDGRVYSCACCGAHLARVDDLVSKIWAEEPSQKYKEGKSIIERTKVVFSKHDDESVDRCPISPMISFVGMTLDSEMEEDGC